MRTKTHKPNTIKALRTQNGNFLTFYKETYFYFSPEGEILKYTNADEFSWALETWDVKGEKITLPDKVLNTLKHSSEYGLPLNDVVVAGKRVLKKHKAIIDSGAIEWPCMFIFQDDKAFSCFRWWSGISMSYDNVPENNVSRTLDHKNHIDIWEFNLNENDELTPINLVVLCQRVEKFTNNKLKAVVWEEYELDNSRLELLVLKQGALK